MVSNVYPIFFSETFFLVKLLWQQQKQLNVLEEKPESFLFASVKVQGISLHCEHILWKAFCLFRLNSLLKPTFVAFEDGGTTQKLHKVSLYQDKGVLDSLSVKVFQKVFL